MPAQTPIGWRIVVGVDAAGDLLGELAQLERADGAGVLDDLEAAEDVALGVGQGLALLGGERLASFFMSRTRAWSLSMMRARAASGVFFQVLYAPSRPRRRPRSSASVANGTRASTCWVAGLTTSCHSVAADSTNWPSISSLTVATVSVSFADAVLIPIPLVVSINLRAITSR